MLREAKAAEAKFGKGYEDELVGLKVAAYPSPEVLKCVDHEMICVHRSCAKVLRKGRKAFVKYHNRQRLRNFDVRKFALQTATLRRESIHVMPLGRDRENSVYYMFGGDRARLYVARPGSSIDDAVDQTPTALISRRKTFRRSKGKILNERFAMNWSWYGSRREIEDLIRVLKVRCSVADDEVKAPKEGNLNFCVQNPERGLLRALEAELTIWDKATAPSVKEEYHDLVQRFHRVENVMAATTKDEFECFLSRHHKPALRFTLPSSSYLLLPRLYVVFKCMRDAVFYCQSQEKDDEVIAALPPLKLLPKPSRPSAPTKRQPTKAEYQQFQIEATGIAVPPKWPPISTYSVAFEVELTDGTLGLELKGSEIPGESPLYIVNIHSGGRHCAPALDYL